MLNQLEIGGDKLVNVTNGLLNVGGGVKSIMGFYFFQMLSK